MSLLRVRPLGAAFDLLASYRSGGFAFEREGVGICAAGAFDLIASPPGPGRTRTLGAAATDRLRALAAPEGPRPVAVGSLPFLPDAGATLTVPRRVACRTEDGETVRLDLDGSLPDEDGGRPPAATAHRPFSDLQVTEVPDGAAWERAVGRAVERIGTGTIRKVVLARTLLVEADRALDAKRLLWHVRSVDPGCYSFAAPQPGGGVLVGATPELLVAKRGRRVRLDPLAGSAPREGDPQADRRSGERLLASVKDRDEHAIVVAALTEALEPLCDDLSVPADPVLLGTANVWHLSTPIRARLRSSVPDVLAVVDAIHPTAAVGGSPTDRALRAIAELEPFDRGGYAGPVGWIDADGDGTWAIALRCAELSGSTARLFAGAGIVAGSEPAAELEETDRKFRALLDALRWG